MGYWIVLICALVGLAACLEKNDAAYQMTIKMPDAIPDKVSVDIKHEYNRFV